MSNGRTILRKVNRTARGTKVLLKGRDLTGWRKRAGQRGRVDKHTPYDTRNAAGRQHNHALAFPEPDGCYDADCPAYTE